VDRAPTPPGGQAGEGQASLRDVRAARTAIVGDLSMTSSPVQCGLPLLIKSGNSKKADLRNPADFQRF
jgi:hypothetical protein